ncbi:MAG: M24B family metallopeptidase, partial [Clostridia bacterium]
MTVNEKINMLRSEMKSRGLNAYIVPTSDPHLSEYVPAHYEFRRWLSGFTGSAGTLVVTEEKSGLWTDGRYYIQAENQLKGSEIELFRGGEPGVKSYIQYLCDEFKEGGKIGICGKLFSQAAAENMNKKFSDKGIILDNSHDLSAIWRDRPPLPCEEVILHDIKWCGETAYSKISRVREEMKKRKLTHYAANKLDCVMWLCNIRGNDVHCCPFAMSYVMVDMEKTYLYIDGRQVSEGVRGKLNNNGIELRPYEDIYSDIENLGGDCTLGIDFNVVNSSIAAAAKNCSLKNTRDIITPFKAVKNEVENKNLLECYENDAVALTKGMYYIYDCLEKGTPITEMDVFDKLIELRAQQPYNMGPSFDTIAAYKGNAAMMHYEPEPDNCATLSKEGMLLIDSGGQYLSGTTDITRTLILGPITEEEKHNFTLVLKANIALISARFLKGTAGANLDILARGPLWREGIDYKCGTGHGVGFFLNVHEGPQNFSQNLRSVPLEIGMNVTVEPGVYIEGKYGIRTENDVVVVPWKKTEHGEFYEF